MDEVDKAVVRQIDFSRLDLGLSPGIYIDGFVRLIERKDFEGGAKFRNVLTNQTDWPQGFKVYGPFKIEDLPAIGALVLNGLAGY